MEIKNCIICGKEFIPTYAKQQCCGRKCAAIMKAEKQKANRILKYCETCGKEMYVSQAFINKKYCCRKCADIGRTTLVKKVCEICGKEFEVIRCRENTAKYCSIECQRKSLRGEDNCTCAQCGKKFHVKPYHLMKYGHSFGNYCSRECLTEARKTLMLGSGNHQYGLKGPLNSSFNGEVILLKNHKLTERMVYCPEHPFCNHAGRVKEHRLIVEQNYQLFDGRYFVVINGQHYLPPHISVHHLDGNHNNNTIENLIPCTKSEHSKYHSSMIIKRDEKGRILETAVIKQGELLGSPEVGNQQPSTGLTTCEGSETRC